MRKNPKESLRSENMCKCPGRKFPRFIEPCLLLLLYKKPSYGYDLIERIGEFGFQESKSDPGAIYRNLRQMEREGLVISEWKVEKDGPARRYYRLTPAGEQLLHSWAKSIKKRREALEKFISQYNQHFKGVKE